MTTDDVESGAHGHTHSRGHDHGHGHSHTHGSHCHNETSAPAATTDNNNNLLCLAVVRENGADVVLFDASGEPRSFSYTGNDVSVGKVCFSTHGQDAADDLMTPCFDEDGYHGVPEESCFCGVETPHLHAHWHDPKTCDDNEHDKDDGHSAKQDENLMKLAKLTLHPTTGEEECEGTTPLMRLPVSDHMPKECNAAQFIHSLSESDHGASSWEYLKGRRRMHKVQHDDHVDYLVHNADTDGLHLEHPCDDCGQDDVHGRFKIVGKRRLTGAASGNYVHLHFFEVERRPFHILDFFKDIFSPTSDRVAAVRPIMPVQPPSCCAGGKCAAAVPIVNASVGGDTILKSKASLVTAPEGGSGELSCCVNGVCAAPAPKPCCAAGTCTSSTPEIQPPPCCVDGVCTVGPDPPCCASGKCSGAILPPDQLMPLDTSKPSIVRSTIVCTKICCSSEIPIINKVLDPLVGVEKIMTNVPLKQVTVDHDVNVITAKEIESMLNKARLGATLKRDGGASAAAANGTGRSQFFVQKICCASEIPAINSILNPIEGVSKVQINVTTKMVYVDHETSAVSAQNLCDTLNKAAFGASIEKDAALSAGAATSSFVCSIVRFSGEVPDTERFTEMMAKFKPSEMESFVVDVPNSTLAVTHNPLLLPIANIVVFLEEQTSLKGEILRDGADGVFWDFPKLEQSKFSGDPEAAEKTPWPRPTVILSGIFWIVSMLSMIGGNWEYLKYVALLAVVFGIPGIAIKAYYTMRRCMFDTNCLMLFAVIGALALQDFTEAAAVTFLFAISEWLEVRATTRARNALSAIVQLRPEIATVVHPNTKEHLVVPASSVPVGAIVSVKTGEKVPCDGVVVEGYSAVDESSLTGESRPVKKGPKSLVSGGTINCGSSHLMIQSTSTAENSAVSRLIRLVEEAQANRSETEKIVDEFAKVYTPIVVLAALCMCTIPWAFGPELGQLWMKNGLVLIVVACPCALIISTPVTYVAGLAATAQRGILIKGGAHLEALGLVKSICFDKTGTLTQGSFALLQLNTIGEKCSRKQVLEYMMMMEERATHPLSLAILDGARNEGISLPKNKSVNNHTFIAGEGLSGQIDGLQVFVGNKRMFESRGLFDSLHEDMKTIVANWEAMAGTVGFMSIEGAGIVCAYCVADAVRPESMEVVEELHRLGIEVNMLTGDNKDAAKAIGRLVGLEQEGIKSELRPEEKLEFISTLKKERGGRRSVMKNPFSTRHLVCMIGDGVNDAPALAAADIGIAMGVGAALAMETADVTLLDSNLKKLLYSLNMGRRVLWKIKENVIFSIVVKLVVLGFTIAGKVELWAAIVSDVGAMICVTLNGMRLLPGRKIDRLKMGDVENVTYHSQVSDMTGNENANDKDANSNDKEINLIDMEIGAGDEDGGHSHEHGTCTGGQRHAHVSSHSHEHACHVEEKEEETE